MSLQPSRVAYFLLITTSGIWLNVSVAIRNCAWRSTDSRKAGGA